MILLCRTKWPVLPMLPRSSGPPACCAPAVIPGQPDSDMRLENLSSPEIGALPAYWKLAARSIGQFRESEMGGLGHACEMETSLMLHLHPGKVRTELARRDGPRHVSPDRETD